MRRRRHARDARTRARTLMRRCQVTEFMLVGKSCLDADEVGVHYSPLTDISLAVRSCGMLAGAIGRIWGPASLPRVFAWLAEATARVLSGVGADGEAAQDAAAAAGGGGGGGAAAAGGDDDDGIISLVPVVAFGGRTRLASQRAECVTALAAIMGHMTDSDLSANVNVLDVMVTMVQVRRGGDGVAM
jgi:hypothetical protein